MFTSTEEFVYGQLLKPVCNVPLTQVFKLSRFLADPTGLLYDSTKRHFRKSCNSVGGSNLQT